MKDPVIRYRLHPACEGRRAEAVRKRVICGKKPSEKAGQKRVVHEAGKFRQIIYQYGIFKYTLGLFFLAYRQIGSPFQKNLYIFVSGNGAKIKNTDVLQKNPPY
jgi:hypothetical protein